MYSSATGAATFVGMAFIYYGASLSDEDDLQKTVQYGMVKKVRESGKLLCTALSQVLFRDYICRI